MKHFTHGNYKNITKKAPETTGNMEESALHELFIDELKDIYWADLLTKIAQAGINQSAMSEKA